MVDTKNVKTVQTTKHKQGRLDMYTRQKYSVRARRVLYAICTICKIDRPVYNDNGNGQDELGNYWCEDPICKECTEEERTRVRNAEGRA